MRSEHVDLVVVGAGPAGLTAAAVAARRGSRVAVIDEHPVPGGKLHTQVHEEEHGWWKGSEIARKLAEEAVAAGAQIVPETSVCGLYPGWEVAVQSAGQPVERIKARCVLLASGACQIPLALPGWTLPGVLTAGAVQMLVNQYGVRPGNRALVIGTDPLSLMAARCLTWAGVQVEGIVLGPPGPLTGDTAVPSAALHELVRHASAAPNPLMRLGGRLLQAEKAAGFAARLYPRAGVRLWGVPLQLRRAAVSIEGQNAVEAVVVADLTHDGRVVPGSEKRIAVDLVSTGAGLRPLTELAGQAGCEMLHVDELGGWVPLHGPNMETRAEGLFVAGSITGVEGASVAIAQGRLAGLAIAVKLGHLPESEREDALQQARLEVETARRKAPIQFYRNPAAGRAKVDAAWGGY